MENVAKMQFLYKIFWKNKVDNADRPYLAFSELKPDTHIHYFA